MKRSNERLIQLARSVNDNVVGTHIGHLCRDMADQLEMMRAAAKGSLMIVEIAMALRREAEKKASDLEDALRRLQEHVAEVEQP